MSAIRTTETVSSDLHGAFASVSGDSSSIDLAFPVMPNSSREIIEGEVRCRVDDRFGEGGRFVRELPGDMRIMAADFLFRDEASAPATGHDFLKFHYKLNGRNVVKFANRPDTLIESDRSVVAYHPEGLHKDDCFAAGVREVSLTIGCRRESVLEILGVSSDELPKPVRRYFDCPDSDFLCDELPLTARMKEALAALTRPAFSPWLRQMHVEAKVLDLICMSLHELTARDFFAGPTVSLKPRDIDMLRAVRQTLEKGFAENITIPSLCRQFATNRSKLSEGFRMLFGETIFEHIHRLRMDHAKFMLSDANIPISEIAARIGYSRQSSFSTAFRAHHGMRPLDVRRVAGAVLPSSQRAPFA